MLGMLERCSGLCKATIDCVLWDSIIDYHPISLQSARHPRLRSFYTITDMYNYNSLL